RFGAAPSELRRRVKKSDAVNGGLVVRLPYRPPLAWMELLEFLAPRATPGVEQVDDGVYRRSIAISGTTAIIEVSQPTGERFLRLRLEAPGDVDLINVVDRVRCLFDLDADPLRIEEHLRRSRKLRSLINSISGLRVPGAWDGFELAVRAILGQQVTVRGATTLAGRLAQAFGQPLAAPCGDVSRLFPTPEALAVADLTRIGLTRARATTVRELAAAVVAGDLRLDGSHDLDAALQQLRKIRGIGDWTAHYIAMRALGEPDAFPAGDLGLRHALGNGSGPLSPRQADQASQAWRPWRSYAAMHLWTHLSHHEVKQ
ncbi:MAG TPA: DNA-3-methyladenine glycosylase, partial [Candidatus Acidoferrales bacterium]|nr:DNA-3-methyladenine glycosylase [Candidatus Acidoferrales bacterium]